MLNAGYKKEALAVLDRANKVYQNTYETTVKNISDLHQKRLEAVKTLKGVEAYIQNLANKPKEYEKIVSEIVVRRNKFESDLKTLELESKKADKVSGSVAGAGVMAGAGVAAFGPTAAMAVAMTFGTASTGTAIATLSGAAATNAALAWLGGGALLAGGGGMAAGETLLALAGPVGWAIGGAALVGGGILANSKNKKIAEKAESSTRTVKRETERIKEVDVKVGVLRKTTVSLNTEIGQLITMMLQLGLNDYKRFTEDNKNNLRKMMNSAEALSKKIGEIVS